MTQPLTAPLTLEELANLEALEQAPHTEWYESLGLLPRLLAEVRARRERERVLTEALERASFIVTQSQYTSLHGQTLVRMRDVRAALATPELDR